MLFGGWRGEIDIKEEEEEEEEVIETSEKGRIEVVEGSIAALKAEVTVLQIAIEELKAGYFKALRRQTGFAGLLQSFQRLLESEYWSESEDLKSPKGETDLKARALARLGKK